jgi:hypothetical protein
MPSRVEVFDIEKNCVAFIFSISQLKETWIFSNNAVRTLQLDQMQALLQYVAITALLRQLQQWAGLD